MVHNFQIFGLFTHMEQLQQQEQWFQLAAMRAAAGTGPDSANPSSQVVSQAHRDRLDGLLKFAAHCADRLQLQAVHDRLEIFQRNLRLVGLTWHECSIQMRTLREAFQSGIQYECFFRYKREDVRLLSTIPSDWSDILTKMDVTEHITAAIDCYALEHHSASVFHLMLIMERGVQAFGKKLGVDLVKKNPGRRVTELTWDQILNEVNPKLKAVPQDTVARKRKHEKYSAVQAYLYGVKDAWRNPTMHPRDEGYTRLQNLDLINHVRSFMTELAEIL
jgi:hypothetical protein